MFGSWIQPKIETKKHGPNRKILTLPETRRARLWLEGRQAGPPLPGPPPGRTGPGRAGPVWGFSVVIRVQVPQKTGRAVHGPGLR